MKTKIDRTKEQIIDRQKKKDKATTVFTKLYAKRRGKYKGWGDVRAETYSPSDKSGIRNELEIR